MIRLLTLLITFTSITIVVSQSEDSYLYRTRIFPSIVPYHNLNEDNIKLDSIYWEPDGTRMKNQYFYNPKGQLDSSNTFRLDDDIFLYSYSQRFNFYDFGKLKNIFQMSYGDTINGLTYNYIEGKYISSTLFQVWLPFFSNALFCEYKYDSLKNLSGTITSLWEDDAWRWSNKVEYVYNEINAIDSSVFSNWVNSNWEYDVSFKYLYTENNELLYIIMSRFENNSWNYYVRNSYEYIDSTKINLIEKWTDGEWQPWGRYRYTTNSKGYFLAGYCELLENGSWVSAKGVIRIINPDGFEEAYECNQAFAFYSSITGIRESEKSGVVKYTLHQNYPNPFNPLTSISYNLNERCYVNLTVYDIKGELIRVLVNEEQESGYYEKHFDGTGLSSGIYFYRIVIIDKGNAAIHSDVKKMIILK